MNNFKILRQLSKNKFLIIVITFIVIMIIGIGLGVGISNNIKQNKQIIKNSLKNIKNQNDKNGKVLRNIFFKSLKKEFKNKDATDLSKVEFDNNMVKIDDSYNITIKPSFFKVCLEYKEVVKGQNISKYYVFENVSSESNYQSQSVLITGLKLKNHNLSSDSLVNFKNIYNANPVGMIINTIRNFHTFSANSKNTDDENGIVLAFQASLTRQLSGTITSLKINSHNAHFTINKNDNNDVSLTINDVQINAVLKSDIEGKSTSFSNIDPTNPKQFIPVTIDKVKIEYGFINGYDAVITGLKPV